MTRHPGDRFDAYIEPLVWTDCLVWVGSVGSAGYGQFSLNGRPVKAHRYAWERLNGPIPDGMVIDHVCYVKTCVNPAHLRLATRAQNTANRSGVNVKRSEYPRGVFLNKRYGTYSAQVTCGRVKHHLGTFPTAEAASIAAQAKRVELFGEFAGRA